MVLVSVVTISKRKRKNSDNCLVGVLISMFQAVRSNYSRFGLAKTLYDTVYRGFNRVFIFQSLTGMTATEQSLTMIDLPEGSELTVKFLSRDELLDFAKDPINELSEEFLEVVSKKGDHCLAILDRDILASYGWYSNKPTRILNNVNLFFSPDWMYMYKGYTRKDYRGMRLHAVGMCHATKHFTKEGFKGLISYVESNNFASMKSVTRMGYKIFGSIQILSAFKRFASFSSSGCKSYQFYASTHDAKQAKSGVAFIDAIGSIRP